MRILRKDKALMGMTISSDPKKNSQYDVEATREFIRLCRSLYPETTLYFNDPVIRGETEFEGIVEYSAKHWDHMHVMPFIGGREGR